MSKSLKQINNFLIQLLKKKQSYRDAYQYSLYSQQQVYEQNLNQSSNLNSHSYSQRSYLCLHKLQYSQYELNKSNHWPKFYTSKILQSDAKDINADESMQKDLKNKAEQLKQINPQQESVQSLQKQGETIQDVQSSTAKKRTILSSIFNFSFYLTFAAAVVVSFQVYQNSRDEILKKLQLVEDKYQKASLDKAVLSIGQELPQNAIQEQFSLFDRAIHGYWNNVLVLRSMCESTVQTYNSPRSEKILPDLPPSLSFLRTLVLDLDELLVYSEWKRSSGWRVYKRPGLEEFLQELSNKFEIVLYTDQLSSYADPIMDRIDPNRQYVMFRLYKDQTAYVNGGQARDLSKLNRDLSKVIFISPNPQAYQLQPENTIKLAPWRKESGDTALLDLVPFLETIVFSDVSDVRQVVTSYDGQDIIPAFKERMKTAKEQQLQRKSIMGGILGRNRFKSEKQ